MDKHPLFGPIATGIVLAILAWAYSTFQNDGILKADQRRFQSISVLEDKEVKQQLKNVELETKLNGVIDLIQAIDSKYDRVCKK